MKSLKRKAALPDAHSEHGAQMSSAAGKSNREELSYLDSAPDYLLANDSFHHYAMRELIRRYGIGKKMKIVDIGCGKGHCLLPLKSMGYKNLQGLDKDSAAKEMCRQNGINFLDADVDSDRIPLESSSTDLVIAFHIIEHIRNTGFFMSEIRRVLKSGGYVFLATPDWRKQFRGFYADPTHIHPYDKCSISRLFRMHGFAVRKCSSFGAFPGLGISQLWRVFPRLMFTGNQIICVGQTLHPESLED